MNAPCEPFAALFGDGLSVALITAQATLFSDRIALYIAGLTDPAGFALATAVHAKIAGPDPAVLRERARACPVRASLMIGAAPVKMLARILEVLPNIASNERRAAAQLIRDIHSRGKGPILTVDDGSAATTTIKTLGWWRPFVEA